MSGRDVYRSLIEFRPVAQHIYSCNQLPKFSGGMDRGVRRRVLPVQFNRIIPVDQRIPNIGLRIAEEEADILLAWIVGGAARLIRQRDFTVPPSSDTRLVRWTQNDPVIAWADVRVTTPDRQPGTDTPGLKSHEAHARFRQWALERGFHPNEIPSINGFVQRLHAHKPAIAVLHRNSGNWLIGLKLLDKDPADDPNDHIDEQPLNATASLYGFAPRTNW
jgi:hypothetical protein